MGTEEEAQQEAAMIAKYLKAHKSLLLLEEKARDLSKSFSGLAATIQPDKIWSLSIELCQPMLSKETCAEIAKLKADLEQGKAEVGEMRARLDDAGLGQFLK
jgi:hypothetical protein